MPLLMRQPLVINLTVIATAYVNGLQRIYGPYALSVIANWYQGWKSLGASFRNNKDAAMKAAIHRFYVRRNVSSRHPASRIEAVAGAVQPYNHQLQ